MKVMADIDPQLVKQLREKTNAGMMDCKRALTEAERRKREMLILAEILACERREEFFIVASQGACVRPIRTDDAQPGHHEHGPLDG